MVGAHPFAGLDWKDSSRTSSSSHTLLSRHPTPAVGILDRQSRAEGQWALGSGQWAVVVRHGKLHSYSLLFLGLTSTTATGLEKALTLTLQ